MMHSKWHWACCWMPVLKKVLWAAAALSLVLAWVSVYRQNLVFGLEPLAWYWNALVMGVLAMGGWGKHCHGGSCEMSEEKKEM
ncbi:MAG: hypothetical protein KGI60_01225 [Patescibacteria group bacterium]|nr:hypothetical protein [Patescibacteria group bacterium]